VWKSRRGRRLEGRTYNERPKSSSHPVMGRLERSACVENVERAISNTSA
jgi:hypothetical protein